MNERSRPQAALKELTGSAHQSTGASALRVLDRLEAAKQTGRDQWVARCPAHDDRTPSLSVTANNGRTLVHCHAGCDAREVVAAIDLTMSDLFDNPGELTYNYPGGRQVIRTYQPDGRKRITQRHTDTPVTLYRLERVQEAVTARRDVYLCEGEEDVRTLEAWNVTATTTPMGASSWHKADYSPLQGARVWIVADNDDAGLKRARGLLDHLPTVGADVRGVVAALHGNDVTDHRAAGGTLADLVELDLTPEPAADDDARAGSTWEPLDVAGIVSGLMAGILSKSVPEVLTRTDGRALFYRGKTNGVHAESGSGKSFVALYAAAQEISAGRAVVYLDFEDSPIDVVGRLLDLGADPADIGARFVYVQPVERFDTARERFLDLLRDLRPSLVVLDSTGESLAAEGRAPNADEDVAAWFAELPKPIARTGAAVLLVDHMPKASDSDLSPIGSQRKRASIDGAQYLLEVVTPFAKGKPGAARLVCAKDRHGNYARGQRVANVTVTPAGDGVSIALDAPEAAPDGSGGFRPTGYMQRVSRALENAVEPLTYRGILDRVEGKKQHIRDAVDTLVREGYVTTTPGPRNSTIHHSVKPFTETNDLGGTLDARSGPETSVDRARSLGGGTGHSHFTVPGEQSGNSGEQSQTGPETLTPRDPHDTALTDHGYHRHPCGRSLTAPNVCPSCGPVPTGEVAA